MQNNKEDVTRLVGRDGISGAWELLENADWTCIINPERKQDTKELFLTFKMLKRRYRSVDDKSKNRNMDYFNQPFVEDSEIMLVDDYDMEKPVYLDSLSTQFEAVVDKRGKTNAIDREDLYEDKKKKKKKKDEDEFSAFNPGLSINI